MPTRVAINGFGRVGRSVIRAAAKNGTDIEIVAVNDLMDPATMAHLLRYDSVFGRFPGTIQAGEGELVIDGRSVAALAVPSPADLPWSELDVDVVIESTGRFRTRAAAAEHLDGGGAQGDHLGAGRRAGADRRDGRPRRQLRRGLRPRAPPHHQQRIVHDELPRAGRKGAARDGRHPPRADDDDSRVHRRPEPARRSAQGSAPGTLRRAQPDPDVDGRREGARARRCRSSTAG